MVQSKAQLDNLKKGKDTQFVSGEKAVRSGKKGGKKSQEVQRQRRKMKDDVAIILNMALKDGAITDIADLQSLAKEHLDDANLTLQQLMILKMSKSVLKNDNVRAFEDIIKLSGETLDRHEINATIEEKPNKKKILQMMQKLDENPELEKELIGDDDE